MVAGGKKRMAEAGSEGLEELKGRLAELSERQAAHARDLVDAIEKRRREAGEQGMNFAAPNADKILQRLQGGNTPFLYYWLWNYRTPAPGTLSISVGVDNPDPVQQFFVYAHFFVGPGSLSADVGQALTLVDTRFPRATEPEYVGLIMAPSEETSLFFQLPISGRIEQSHYFGNLLLLQVDPFTPPGTVLDRASLVFKIRDAR
jgi:hypothetical protein